MNPPEIRALNDDAKTSGMLADLLIETVAAGGSVSFMHPLSPDAAHEFWRKSLAAAARGERAVLGAWDGKTLAGTVTLLLDCPPNQPHRAEIAKLMTRLDYRGKGIASGRNWRSRKGAPCWCWTQQANRGPAAFTKNSASR